MTEGPGWAVQSHLDLQDLILHRPAALAKIGDGQFEQLDSLLARPEGDNIYKVEKVVPGISLQLR